MTDTASEPNYQDILDKYADSIKSTELPPTLKPEPELESTPAPESLLDAELTPESKLEINSEPDIETPVNPQSQPEFDTQPKPEIETQPQSELAPEPLNLTTPPAPESITTSAPPEELTPESSDLLPPKENHFFKYLFFFSLFIFLIVLASVIFSFINSQKSLSNTQNSPANVSPTVAPVGVCEVNGQTYTIGESFPATDGCNSCSCDESLQIACTSMACEPTKSATGSAIQSLKTYENITAGISFKYPSNFSYNEKVDPYFVFSVNPLIKITVHTAGNPMYNECMTITKTETIGTLMIKRYSSIKTGEACSTVVNVEGLDRQIWVTKAGGDGFQPGIILNYSSVKATESEKIFTQILPTFKFL